jgi:hypothetical protein
MHRRYVCRSPTCTILLPGNKRWTYADLLFGVLQHNCHLGQDEQHILTLACRTGEAFPVPRYRMHIFNVREDRMLRCEFVLSERKMAASKNPADVRLDLGDHPIAQELRDLGIVRAAGCQYAPQVQAVLTPVVESLPM